MIIATIIGLFLLVGACMSASHGNWGPVAVVAVIALLAFGLSSASTRDSKAYIARQEYWEEQYDRKYRKRR